MGCDGDDVWKHIGQIQCKTCGFVTSEQSLMYAHTCRKQVVSRSGKSSVAYVASTNCFTCSLCKFTAKEHDFVQHLQEHLLYTPFKCDTCNESFTTVDTVRNHIITEHPSADGNFSLTVSGKTRVILKTARRRGHAFFDVAQSVTAPLVSGLLTSNERSAHQSESSKAPVRGKQLCGKPEQIVSKCFPKIVSTFSLSTSSSDDCKSATQALEHQSVKTNLQQIHEVEVAAPPQARCSPLILRRSTSKSSESSVKSKTSPVIPGLQKGVQTPAVIISKPQPSTIVNNAPQQTVSKHSLHISPKSSIPNACSSDNVTSPHVSAAACHKATSHIIPSRPSHSATTSISQCTGLIGSLSSPYHSSQSVTIAPTNAYKQTHNGVPQAATQSSAQGESANPSLLKSYASKKYFHQPLIDNAISHSPTGTTSMPPQVFLHTVPNIKNLNRQSHIISQDLASNFPNTPRQAMPLPIFLMPSRAIHPACGSNTIHSLQPTNVSLPFQHPYVQRCAAPNVNFSTSAAYSAFNTNLPVCDSLLQNAYISNATPRVFAPQVNSNEKENVTYRRMKSLPFHASSQMNTLPVHTSSQSNILPIPTSTHLKSPPFHTSSQMNTLPVHNSNQVESVPVQLANTLPVPPTNKFHCLPSQTCERMNFPSPQNSNTIKSRLVQPSDQLKLSSTPVSTLYQMKSPVQTPSHMNSPPVQTSDKMNSPFVQAFSDMNSPPVQTPSHMHTPPVQTSNQMNSPLVQASSNTKSPPVQTPSHMNTPPVQTSDQMSSPLVQARSHTNSPPGQEVAQINSSSETCNKTKFFHVQTSKVSKDHSHLLDLNFDYQESDPSVEEYYLDKCIDGFYIVNYSCICRICEETFANVNLFYMHVHTVVHTVFIKCCPSGYSRHCELLKKAISKLNDRSVGQLTQMEAACADQNICTKFPGKKEAEVSFFRVIAEKIKVEQDISENCDGSWREDCDNMRRHSCEAVVKEEFPSTAVIAKRSQSLDSVQQCHESQSSSITPGPCGASDTEFESAEDDIRDFSCILNSQMSKDFYKCSFNKCKFSAHQSILLLIHMESDHGNEDEFYCIYCGYMGDKVTDLVHHFALHNSSERRSYAGSVVVNDCVSDSLFFECPTVNKLVSALEGENHSMCYFRCETCKSRFSSVSKLKIHLETSSLKTYGCRFCSSVFLDSKACEAHFLEFHPGQSKFNRVIVNFLCWFRREYFESFRKILKQYIPSTNTAKYLPPCSPISEASNSGCPANAAWLEVSDDPPISATDHKIDNVLPSLTHSPNNKPSSPASLVSTSQSLTVLTGTEAIDPPISGSCLDEVYHPILSPPSISNVPLSGSATNIDHSAQSFLGPGTSVDSTSTPPDVTCSKSSISSLLSTPNHVTQVTDSLQHPFVMSTFKPMEETVHHYADETSSSQKSNSSITPSVNQLKDKLSSPSLSRVCSNVGSPRTAVTADSNATSPVSTSIIEPSGSVDGNSKCAKVSKSESDPSNPPSDIPSVPLLNHSAVVSVISNPTGHDECDAATVPTDVECGEYAIESARYTKAEDESCSVSAKNEIDTSSPWKKSSSLENSIINSDLAQDHLPLENHGKSPLGSPQLCSNHSKRHMEMNDYDSEAKRRKEDSSNSVHGQRVLYKCKFCDFKSEWDPDLMKFHLRSSKNHLFYKCFYCGNPYFEQRTMKNHIRFHHGNEPFRYTEFGIEQIFFPIPILETKTPQSEIRKPRTRKSVRISVCNKLADRVSTNSPTVNGDAGMIVPQEIVACNLLTPIQAKDVKKKVTLKKFKCERCHMEFTSVLRLKLHCKIAHVGVVMKWIDKSTFNTYSLSGKLLDGEDIKEAPAERYLCNLCGYRSETRSSVHKHQDTRHEYEASKAHVIKLHGFSAFIKKSSPSTSNSDNDGRSVIFETQTKNNVIRKDPLQYNCHLCSASLRSEFFFRIHLAKHNVCKHTTTLSTQDGLLICGKCNYVAQSSTDLANHVTSHVTSRRYACSFCETESHHRKDIASHIDKKHKNESSAEVIDRERRKGKALKLKVVNLNPVVSLRANDPHLRKFRGCIFQRKSIS